MEGWRVFDGVVFVKKQYHRMKFAAPLPLRDFFTNPLLEEGAGDSNSLANESTALDGTLLRCRAALQLDSVAESLIIAYV